MADPTAAQRRMFSKMGLAMPDGSYYIRKGSVGASDLKNAVQAVGRGVAAGRDGDAIRRHIMTRAEDLKMTHMIPDTWNSDGSLKHEDVPDDPSEFLEHFGVKGMHWGVHKQRQLELHTLVASGKAGKAAKLAAFNEMSALDLVRHKGSVVSYSKERATRLRAQKTRVQSGNATLADKIDLAAKLMPEDLIRKLANKPRPDRQPAYHSDVDGDILEHFGVKGMHWGVRRAVKPSGPSSEDHAHVTKLKEKVKAGGGIHALSNKELQDLTSRLNLESNYHRLTELDGAHVKNGEKFVRDNLSRVNLAINAAKTGKQVYDLLNDPKKK